MSKFLKTQWGYRNTRLVERARQHWIQADLVSPSFFIVEGLNKKGALVKEMLGDPVVALDFCKQLAIGSARITMFDQSTSSKRWACGVVQVMKGRTIYQVDLIETDTFELAAPNIEQVEDQLITLYRLPATSSNRTPAT